MVAAPHAQISDQMRQLPPCAEPGPGGGSTRDAMAIEHHTALMAALEWDAARAQVLLEEHAPAPSPCLKPPRQSVRLQHLLPGKTCKHSLCTIQKNIIF